LLSDPVEVCIHRASCRDRDFAEFIVRWRSTTETKIGRVELGFKTISRSEAGRRFELKLMAMRRAGNSRSK
jgi:hypothetical protein